LLVELNNIFAQFFKKYPESYAILKVLSRSQHSATATLLSHKSPVKLRPSWSFTIHSYARSQNGVKQVLTSKYLFARMEKLGSNWTDFHKI
jgi:hypothetical protein